MKHLSTTVRGLPPDVSKEDIRNFFQNSPDISSCVIGPIIKDSRNGSCSTTVTFQSKKHGRSCEKIKESFHGLAFYGNRTSTLSVTDDFLGLTALAGEHEAPVQYVNLATD